MVIKVTKGWINYHGISDNKHRVRLFLEKTKYIIHKWMNRRGGKRYVTWTKLMQNLNLLGFPSKWKVKSMFQ